MKNMNRRLFAALFFSFFIYTSYSQNTWIQRANFANPHRERATGFSIGNKGYFGLGYDGFYKNDFWEYNPNTNIWTQKANFGGSARSSAVGFGIGSRGYIGTGYDGIFKNDCWEYNPGNNIWTQKAPMPAGPRTVAVGFSIGNKGYIGTGSGGGNYNDFWEYNPGSNSWVAKANYGGGSVASATGFSIGNKGYIGTGQDAGGNLRNDFWEFDPGNNTWIQKANFGGTARKFASAFSIGNKGFIGLGEDGMFRNDFWEYDTIWNSWIQRANFGGSARLFAAGFSIGTSGFLGSGISIGDIDNDFWEYVPLSPLVISAISDSPFCSGNTIQVSYTTSNIYNAGNIFSAELSDALGSFAFPVVIGSLASTNSGTISCLIPQNTPAGSAYRIRITSSIPANIGSDNGVNLTICSVTWPISLTPVCPNSPSFILSGGSPSGGTYSGPGVVDGVFNPSLLSPGTYTLVYTVLNTTSGCNCSATNTITILSPPVVTWPVSFSPLCGTENPFALTGGLPAGGTYSGPGVDAFGIFHPGYVPFGTTTLTYTYIDNFGCTGSTTNTIILAECSSCGECSTAGPELIYNGNFNSGDTGFFSNLKDTCICKIGSYCVTTNSFLKCNNFYHVSDHTSGNGDFLVVDGSQTSNKIIWEQNISVVAGTTYHFSFWLHPAVSDGFFKANLRIDINNISQYSFSMLNMAVQWNKQVITWVSNITGSVPVTILQTNSGDYGYDYGIDDISFNACIPNVVADGGPDRIICSGDTVHLNSSNNLFTNNWYEVNTGNPANYPFVGSGDIVVSPTSNKCYLLRVCNGNCCDSDSVCIVVNPKPIVTWPISYSNVCTNQAPVHLVEGLPAGGVYSGPGISGNYFDPALAALGNNIIYYRYTNSFGCSDSISNTIKVVHCVECGPCFIEGPDLVVNGDFESGNTGFSSALFLYTGCSYGTYDVVNTASQKCNLFFNIPDHTTGTGKYMVNDGNLLLPKDIWTENVNVTIGNTYKFSFWMHPELSIGTSRADIDMMINGSVKMNIVGQNVPNQWTNYVVSWVSNVNGIIPITLHQSNIGGNGFDYGFDDIVFKECISILEVSWPIAFVDVCIEHQPFLLTGGMPSGGTYSGQGVSNNIFDPSSVLPGTYILTYTYTDDNGCTNFTTNTITVRALPSVTWPVSFSPVCGNLSAFLLNGGLPLGGIYSGPGVDASGNFNPSQVPFGSVTLTYTYTDGFGCTNSATNTINVINCIDCGACYTPGPNLFINGDFSNGNTGFSSALPVSCTCLVGSYCVATDSYLKCNGFFHINDHTSGTGNFLVIDGSESSNVVVWQQNVAVAGSTTYTFSFWVHPQVSFINSNPILNIIIDNVSQGLINTALLPKQWNNIVFSWTSTSPANISVSIRQTNSEFSGMDYGLDDFSFNACIPNLNIDAGQDISICSGTSTQLTAVIPGAYTGVSWSPANGLSCTSCLNPVAFPTVTTTYTILVTTADGCTYSDQVTVTVFGCAVNLHLKTFIEGFYLNNGTMIAVVDPTNYPTLCDTIIVELHNASSPYSLVHSVKNTIDVNGNGQFIFPSDVLTNSYYIVIRHRNSIETWSKTPVLFNGAVVSFDFTGP